MLYAHTKYSSLLPIVTISLAFSKVNGTVIDDDDLISVKFSLYLTLVSPFAKAITFNFPGFGIFVRSILASIEKLSAAINLLEETTSRTFKRTNTNERYRFL